MSKIIVKFTSGTSQERKYQFGRHELGRAYTVRAADGDVVTINDPDEKVRAAAIQYQEDGELEILEGPQDLAYESPQAVNAFGHVSASGDVVDASTVTVDETVFEFHTDGGEVSGDNVHVDTSDGNNTAGSALEQLRDAINQRTHADAFAFAARGPVGVDGDQYLIVESTVIGADGNGGILSIVDAGATLGTSGDLHGGVDGGVRRKVIYRVPGVTGEPVVLITPFSAVHYVNAYVLDANNDVRADYDATITVEDGVVSLVGGTNPLLDDETLVAEVLEG